MKIVLSITIGFLLIAILLTAYFLRSRNNVSVLSNMGIADLTGVISLALNAALFVLTILSLAIAVAAFKASEKSGGEQLETLSRSRDALQTTADTLKTSAQDFRDSAQAAKGQYAFLLGEKQEREDAVMSTVYKELSSNELALEDNEKSLVAELTFLKESKSLIGPINTLQTGSWELLRVYLPHQISGKAAVLERVTEVYKLTLRVNELVRSREEYRLNNGAMDNFHTRMTAYDQQLQGLDAKVLANLKELLNILKPMIKAST